MNVTYLFLTFFLLFTLLRGFQAMSTWNLHDICGTSIGRYDGAGELYFDAGQLPTNLAGNACKVTITPAEVDSTEYGMVQFYFTTFQIYDSCQNANVTVIDGASNNDDIVKGLPRYLCGQNSTLVGSDQYFTSSGSSIKISFNVNDGGRIYSGTFAMKFVSYHEGSCSGISVHECSNGHCISSDYSCLDDFNACGLPDDSCDTDTDTTGNLSVVSTIATVFFVAVFVIFTVCGFYMVKRNRHSFSGGGSNCSCCDCLAGCAECTSEACGACCGCTASLCSRCWRCTKEKCSSVKNSCSERCRDCGTPTGSPEERPSGAGIATQTTQTSTHATTSQPSSSESESSSMSSLEMESEVTPSAPPIPPPSTEAPPPSYEEAVAPSYDEYIANENKYKKHPKPKKR